jgi:hypothetical protein
MCAFWHVTKISVSLNYDHASIPKQRFCAPSSVAQANADQTSFSAFSTSSYPESLPTEIGGFVDVSLEILNRFDAPVLDVVQWHFHP